MNKVNFAINQVSEYLNIQEQTYRKFISGSQQSQIEWYLCIDDVNSDKMWLSFIYTLQAG